MRRFRQLLQSLPDGLHLTQGLPAPLRCGEHATAASASFGGRIARRRLDVALRFQSFEDGVHRAQGNGTPRLALDVR